jgi:hypothetical protein
MTAGEGGSDKLRAADRQTALGPEPKVETMGASPHGVTDRLTKRAALTVVLALSLGLWAAIWTAVASFASAVFG